MTIHLAIILTSAFVFTACSNGQQTKHPDKSDTNFSKGLTVLPDSINVLTSKLPICINYKESAFDEANALNFNEYAEADEEYLKGKIILVKKYVKKYFSNADSVYNQNIWSGDTVSIELLDTHLSGNDYYLIDTIIRTKHFAGVIFERIEGSGSEKYLCTFNNIGDLISKISIAFYMQSGTYTHVDGGRRPWWAEKTGCITEDLLVNTDEGNGRGKKFKIQMDGTISEIK